MGDLKIPSLFEISCNWKFLRLPASNCYLYVCLGPIWKVKQQWQFGNKI